MHSVGNSVSADAGVEDEHFPPHAAEDQCRAQPGRPGADDDDIEPSSFVEGVWLRVSGGFILAPSEKA